MQDRAPSSFGPAYKITPNIYTLSDPSAPRLRGAFPRSLAIDPLCGTSSSYIPNPPMRSRHWSPRRNWVRATGIVARAGGDCVRPRVHSMSAGSSRLRRRIPGFPTRWTMTTLLRKLGAPFPAAQSCPPALIRSPTVLLALLSTLIRKGPCRNGVYASSPAGCVLLNQVVVWPVHVSEVLAFGLVFRGEPLSSFEV